VHPVTIPDGFLSFSTAVYYLAQGIWGGVRRPVPVRAVKREQPKLSVGFGPWKEQAGEILRAATTEGKLAVHIFADVQPSVTNLEPNPVVLPRDVLTRMIPARGTLPDHTIRPSMKIAGGDARILKLLELGILLVGVEEFNIWYKSERVKGKWPSQRSGLKKREGRPSKQTDALRNAVIVVFREKKTSIAELRRRLLVPGHVDVPSRDTLRRAVDNLHRETGEPKLRRRKRVRR
jgi:hypothetical protein